MTATPITLEWSERRDGSWHAIAANIAHTGRYSWQVPEGMPYQVFLRVRARDAAGNEGVAITPEPQLVDLSEPEGRLLNLACPAGRKRGRAVLIRFIRATRASMVQSVAPVLIHTWPLATGSL